MSHNSYKQKNQENTYGRMILLVKIHSIITYVSHVFKIVQMVPNCAKNLQECSCL